jgi:hypothetical protein
VNNGYNPTLTRAQEERYVKIARLYDEILAETGNDYRYQLPHIRRLVVAVNFYGAAPDASDTGTGKTFTALAVFYILGLIPVVVTPKAVIPAWKKAAALMRLPLAGCINYELLRTGKTPLGSWSDKKKRVFQWSLDKATTGIIFDEGHKMKDYTTQNCHIGLAAWAQRFTFLDLSATLADNPLHMKIPALAAGLITHPAHFWAWALQRGVIKGKFGHFFGGSKAVLRDLHETIFPQRGSRMRILDLGDKFPDTKIIAEPYDINGATVNINKVYAEMKRELAALAARKAHDRGDSKFTIILRARQEVELLKVPTFCAMAQDGLAEGMSVIVALNFDASIVAFAARMKTGNIIRGIQPGETADRFERNRERIRSAFDEDEIDLLVLNIRAGGVGISLHGTRSSRPRLVLISPTYSGQDLKQMFGRAWRAGGAPSIQKVVFAADTIEEQACGKVRRKIKQIDLINDGDLNAGIDF